MPLFGTVSPYSNPIRTRLKYMKKLFRAIGMTLLCAGSAHAGSAFFDFNSDPSASGLLTNYNNATWSPVDGAGLPQTLTMVIW